MTVVAAAHTQHSVMASDGLWDCASQESAGRLADRTRVDDSQTRSHKQHVSQQTEHCLQHVAYQDDVIIL
jgi:serine/threonine protein phosphatase PrpC